MFLLSKRIKKYVVGLIIKTSSDATNVEKEKVYIGKLNMILVQFLNVPMFRNVTLKCLTEIAGVSVSQYEEQFVTLFTLTMMQLKQALHYMLLVSEVEETEIFKICLEYWNHLAAELYRESPFSTSTSPLLSGSQHFDVPPRRQLYLPVLSKGRLLMVSRMAKPEEVLVVENDQGEVVREFMKDTDSINLYKNMRETLVYLTHLDYADTERIMTEKLHNQVNGTEWSWKNLNTLCWAIGSISGAMHEEDEKRFLVTVIKDLLGLCEQKRGKDNKAIIASNIMYIVGQYPRFLRAHWKFLKTVVNKLFEFMHETHDGVQDMACDTFIKIAQKCRRHFVQVQVGEVMPFIDEILNNINTIICDLQPQQVHTFYEAVGYMIGAQTDQTVQEHLIEKYMLLPNQVWDSIIQQATKNVDILKDPETVKQLGSILKTNVRACKAVGHPFVIQLGRIYLDMLNVYKCLSENISAAIQTNVLIDYQRNVPAAREPEVLSTMATIVNKLGGHITAEIPQIFDAVFECTLNMINKDFEEYPEHRTNFFLLLQAVNLHCFPAFLAIPPAQFKLVLDSIIWAFKHTMRNVADTGLQILYTLLQNVAQEEAAAQSFYQTYFCEILQHIFSVVTDTSHTAGLTMHASILTYMFNLVEEGKINAALNPATPVNNQMFIQEYVANLLKSAFPHLQDAQVKVFVTGLFSLNQDIPAFKEHLRDFLVQIKEFAGEDTTDLFLEERESSLRQAQEEKHKLQMSVPGILNPHEIPEEMQCLCCFKEYKHLEVFNQVVYALINLVVAQVQALQDQLYKSCTNDTDSDWADVTQQSDEPVNVERDSNEEEGESEGQNSTESKPDSSKACGRTEDVSAKSPDAFSAWNTEEKEKLLLCVAKIFQIQFPLYTAYKHNTHPTIEDVEVPLHLLRYVCLFCGKHGLSLMKDCFESGTPETLPFPIAHAFITVVSNIRIWLHIPAVMQHIIPFRTYVIRYLCKLSDQELRQSAARNMADLMWSTVKEPLDTALCFDKESLDLAFKYFMSPTLTMRLAGLSQITKSVHTIHLYLLQTVLHYRSIAKELADWLINNNVVEHIFGPNLHIELKHCSRYIHDLFPSFIKNLDPVPLRHLLNLVSALHPSAHTEQTLYLASMLIKALWNNALTAKAQLSKQSSFASLLNTNLPMGNKKGSPAASPESSDNSDTHHSGGSDIEMDEQIMNRAKRVQQRLSDTEESMQGSSDETANSGEDASSGPGSSSGRSDGSSNEVNSSHASQSAGSPVSEVHSEDMADSEALKEEEEEEEEEDIEVERGRSPQKESRNPELRKRKLESHAIPICLGEPQGATDRSGANSGTGKDLPFNPEAVSSVDSRMRMLDASSHPEDPDHDMAEEISSTQLSQGSQDPCISRPGDFMGEAIGNELFNCRRFIGPQHHHHHPHHHHPHHHAHEGHIDDMLSADDVSCSSSQVSAKSEKNMADFDGEESGCEEELVQINSHAELTSHLQHLPNLASIYHEHLSQVGYKCGSGLSLFSAHARTCRLDTTVLRILCLKALYEIFNQMPQLKPEIISMTGLNLFQHLCNLARLATSAYDSGSNCELCGMDQLWGIALRAQSADVSRAAIQYINSYYINGKTGLEKEQEFISKCMESLMMASGNLEKDPHSSLTIIERGLLMLKTHLEAFRRRFAYHLRQWQIDGKGISSHLKALSDKQSLPLRIVCQPAGLPDKMTIEMYPSDQVADLRAEVTHWYENLQKEQMNQQAQLQEFGQNSRQGDFPGGLMGPVRMISSGHELTTDYDEKTLHELGFKDMQMVFVSLGAPRRERKGEGVQLPASCLPPPQKDNIPMLLLLQEPHLTTLFDLLEMLASFKPPFGERSVEDTESARCEELHLNAENLSRRVWELLMLLPTCPNMLQAFQNISEEGSYSDLYPDSDDSSEDQIENSKNSWSCKFVSSGGLQLLLEIFNSAILEPKDQESWTVWLLDCLACLLKLICQFAVDPADLDLAYHDVFAWSGVTENHRKRAWPGKSRKGAGDHVKGLHIPRLTEVFLSLVQGTNLIHRLISVAYTYDNLAHRVLKAQSDHRSRHEVTHYSMWLLVSWAHCCSVVKTSLADSEHLHDWLKKLTLLVPETAVRHEACNGLYKLSLSGLEGGESIHRSFLLLASSTLLKFLPDAQALKPVRVEDYEDEPVLRTGCKEYFWLLCKLIDNIHVKDASQTTLLDLDALARHLADCIRSREILDQQDGNLEDDGLTGLLRLATSVVKHKPPFKFSQEGQDFLKDVFNLLFLLPSLKDRHQPKCKSHSARAAAYDLLVEMVKGSVENYRLLHNSVIAQHMQSSHAPYKWDYWPHDDVRAECRFVGLTNLGATCYLASTIQQLYMIPEARQAVFTAKYAEEIKHKTTLLELQKMFTYLMESERKAYNPRPFCKTYTMDKQPLNTGEQKDMTEFFTDLITKIEEMSPDLSVHFFQKNTVKSLFGGVITNNVVSLDCEHVSQTAEEFYTVRCQVADMKNIYESLDEVTIKDTLEGDNMYTCSQCGKKVRAEKRACFKKLPRILSFNTMRYTFNMVTMMKEKVNTHFSFPLRLDMTPYTEDFLMGKCDRKDGFRDEGEAKPAESYEYDLIGVTVHTGTADGGHYYSFIRDIVNPHAYKNNKWYLFNDAEVKTFDSAQLASECFGGEMTTKTYDSVTDKFMDFSFEKTHSAYMLFYKRVEMEEENGRECKFDVSSDLLEWIWHDNMQFLQDKNIFEHTYFGFMWQLCSSIPSTLPDPKAISLMTAKWFLDRMADDDWWPMQILIKCPNQIVRQMFQRLCIHVIQRLRPVHAHLFLKPGMEDGSDDMDGPEEDIGSRSCVTRFVKTLLSIMEHGVKPHSKHLTEYFAFLYEFAKMGEEESQFLLSLQAISIMVHFYMGTKGPENPQVEVLSEEEGEEEEEEEDILSLAEEKYRPAALEKMIALIALLVEQSRSERHLTLSQNDMAALTGGKIVSMLFTSIAKLTPEAANPFFKLLTMLMEFAGGPPGMPSFASCILQRIWEVIEYNPSQCLDWLAVQTPRNKLSHSWVLQNMENWVERFLLAHNYPRVRTSAAYLLVSLIPSNSFRQMFRSTRSLHIPTRDLPLSPDTTVVLHQVYNVLLGLLSRAKMYVDAVVHGTTKLVQYFSFMTYCLISKTEKLMFSSYFMDLWNLFQPKLSEPAIATNHNKQALLSFWYNVCVDCPENVRLIVQNPVVTKNIAFNYILADHDDQDVVLFNRGMLPAYYGILRMCCEQSPAFTRQLASHQNIQWAFKNLTPHASSGRAFQSHAAVCRSAFRHARGGVGGYKAVQENNNQLLSALLRWAFLLDYPYQSFNTLHMMYHEATACHVTGDLVELLSIFLSVLKATRPYLQRKGSGRAFQSHAAVCRSAFRHARGGVGGYKAVQENNNQLLSALLRWAFLLDYPYQSFNTLHMMYHEATACHVTGDLVELLSIFLSVLKATRPYLQRKDVKQALIQWQERIEFAHKLLTLLNSYSPPELRNACLDVLKELVLLSPHDFLHTLVPFLQHNHCTYHHSNVPMSFGPYFPCRENIKLMGGKNNIRPPRPELNMCLLPSMVETSQGKDEVYDRMLLDYFLSYHQFIHLLCRVAINCEKFTETLIKLSVLIAYEGLPLHLALFPKLWTELCQSQSPMAKNCVTLLCEDPAFAEYIKCILMDERTFLNNNVVYTFLTCFLLKVQSQVLSGSSCANLINILVTNLINEYHNLESELTSQRVEVCKTSIILNADLRAFILMLSVHTPKQLDPALIPTLQDLLNKCRTCLQQRNAQELEAKERKSKDDEGATPVKRRRVSSDEDHPLESCSGDLKSEPREALTPASTSDTETRDSSVIDPGTEQDPPTPENVSVKEDKMESISLVSENAVFCSRPSEEQGEGESKIEECKDVKEEMQGIKTSIVAEEDSEFPSTSVFAGLSDMVDLRGCENQTLLLQDPETSLTASCAHSRGLFNFMQQHDILDTLCRTIESTISVVTKLPGKGNRAAS
ncbi:UNVERIFIED_CONTAM: hypothetical protein FKN15_009228 [Acipenser sinensis]